MTVPSSAPAPVQPPRWERVLWKGQPQYADNYVDDSFLQALVVNAELPVRHYWPVVRDAVAVSQQLSVVMASVVVPLHLHSGRVSVAQLLGVDAVLLAGGYLTCWLLGGHLLGGSLVKGMRQAGLLVGGVFFLAPLLHTLAATVSADSVIALTAAALLLHLFLHDYSFVNSVTKRLTGTLSLAAAMLAAVLVASLMPSDLHVFGQVLLALELFLLSPFVRRYIRVASQTAHIVLAVGMAAATAGMLAVLSGKAAVAYAAAHVLLTFVCPYWLVHTHSFKANISGPWDEAVPDLPDTLMFGPSTPAASHTGAAPQSMTPHVKAQ